jgi:pantetheine-phosphate adenylyltransferase
MYQKKANTGMSKRLSKQVVVGGTFDYIHAGHILLLNYVFSLSNKVIIGLSSDSFLEEIGKYTDHNYKQRFERLRSYLKRKGALGKCSIFELKDRYGPALSPKSDTIVVSEETQIFADECNLIRFSMGLTPLVKVVVPLVYAEDGERISSTKIRKREIDFKGQLLCSGRRGTP